MRKPLHFELLVIRTLSAYGMALQKMGAEDRYIEPSLEELRDFEREWFHQGEHDGHLDQ